ncbi:MAG: DUF3343 domain-containing protein [Clostridia bacterium]|nr:DUF3343 domain-containing protein [Candidatus Pelethousia sp.]NCB31154.1 DUF3343 domain-containing protein [Clostridia bacterium]
MRANRYYMLSFESTHKALSAQRHLQGKVPAAVMPTLRAVQAGCGISLRVEEENLEALRALLSGFEKEGWKLYFVEGESAPQVTQINL